ncbi:hypothetical protein [Caldithrix abyssi]
MVQCTNCGFSEFWRCD